MFSLSLPLALSYLNDAHSREILKIEFSLENKNRTPYVVRCYDVHIFESAF